MNKQNIIEKLNFLHIKKPNVWFENGANVSRVCLLLLLLILGFINADVSFIKNNPREFLTETILVSIFAAIPFILMAYNRYANKGKIISIVFIIFLFFFLFNTLMELAGLNGYLNGYKLIERQQQNRIGIIKSQLWFWIIVLIIGLIMIYLSIITYDFPKSMIWNILLIEISVFSILNTIPQSIISYNRGGNITYATSLSLIFYIGLYLILQSGGFFTHFLGSSDHANNFSEYTNSTSELSN